MYNEYYFPVSLDYQEAIYNRNNFLNISMRHANLPERRAAAGQYGCVSGNLGATPGGNDDITQ